MPTPPRSVALTVILQFFKESGELSDLNMPIVDDSTSQSVRDIDSAGVVLLLPIPKSPPTNLLPVATRFSFFVAEIEA